MWYKEIDEVKERLKTSYEGLSEKEAQSRLDLNGKNEIPQEPKSGVLKIFLNQFISPIIGILIIAAIFSIMTKSYADAIFIFIVIMINSIISTYQEWSSEKSAEKLQQMIKISSKVIRNNNQLELDSSYIVKGDVVCLEAGDKIPADIRLFETYNFSTDESILTGESNSKEKDNNIIDENTSLADRNNIAYAGTIVVKGRAKGFAYATGYDTEFGKIANNVITSEYTKSPLIIKIEKFVKELSIGFIILALILAFALYFKGYKVGEIFETVVALTVSAIPEGLTIAMTIVLSISSAKMAKKKVIVKKLNAVESLGSCSVIATDKTGTLTANEQTAKKIVIPDGTESYIKGVGYNDIGEVILEDNISKENLIQIKKVISDGVLNNEAILRFENNKWFHYGDEIDTAFLSLGYKMQIYSGGKVIARIPYESKQKFSAVWYREEKVIVTVKGATEKVLEFCNTMKINSKAKKINKELIINQSDKLASEGYRIIGVAEGEDRNLKFKNEYSEKDIPKMCFLGLVAFIDPIREDVIEAVQMCKDAGIRVIMITGDYRTTAEAIAKKIGIEEVYSRATPIEKLEIVEKLRNQGEFVAVTGDGVNDSPALKKADIGVAMGSGTDIAKETGNMIITDDNFSTIVKGVEEGRRSYNNIRKVIYLLLSTGFSEIIVFILSIIFDLPIPLLAIQLLWLNLITNGIQGDALAFEEDKEDVMKTKSQNHKESIFNKFLINEILVSSIAMGVIEFVFYLYLLKVKLYDITLVRTYMLTLMVFMENIHIFNCRSERISCFKISGYNNRFLIFSIIIACIIQILILRIESVSLFFKMTTLSVENAGLLFILTIPIIIIMEIFKKINKKY